MIQWLMALALRERVVVSARPLCFSSAGLYSFTQLDIEAYPDPVQPMTEVLTCPADTARRRSSGWSRFRLNTE